MHTTLCAFLTPHTPPWVSRSRRRCVLLMEASGALTLEGCRATTLEGCPVGAQGGGILPRVEGLSAENARRKAAASAHRQMLLEASAVAEQEVPCLVGRTAERQALAKAHRQKIMDAHSAHRHSADELSGEDTQEVTGSGADEGEARSASIPREFSLNLDDSEDSGQERCTSSATSRAIQLCDKGVQVCHEDVNEDCFCSKRGLTEVKEKFCGIEQERKHFEHERMLFEQERQRWLDEKSEWERERIDRDMRCALCLCMCMCVCFSL